jgi:hypothetical protein
MVTRIASPLEDYCLVKVALDLCAYDPPCACP